MKDIAKAIALYEGAKFSVTEDITLYDYSLPAAGGPWSLTFDIIADLKRMRKLHLIRVHARKLSSLTDEEIVTLAQIIYPNTTIGPVQKGKMWKSVSVVEGFYENRWVAVQIDGQGDEICVGVGNELSQFNLTARIGVFDYLRSLHIDLPSYFLDGETLEANGLAIIQEVSHE